MKTIARFSITTVILILSSGLLAFGQRSVSATHFVTNTNDSGPGSLRQAIIDSNVPTGADTIAFNIPTTDPNYSAVNGWWVIKPATMLDSLSDGATHINGKTQTETWGDQNSSGPEVLLDGSLLGGSMSLLTIQSDNNQVEGLTIANAPGPGVNIITGADNNTINDNYIGSDPTGMNSWGNETGVKISSGSKYNIIYQNVISGNDFDGILITGSGTDENYIRSNTIGLKASGNTKLSNGGSGIAIMSGSSQNILGSVNWWEEHFGNTISGNNQHGVLINGSGTRANHLRYNYIGLNSSGGASGDIGNLLSGVLMENGTDDNSIFLNVISGNHKNGVYINGSGTEGNSIFDNIIGADKDITALIPNYNHGVAIYGGATQNEIGRNSSGWQGNVIVGNGWSGIVIQESHNNEIYDNSVGTDRSNWASNLGNKYYGIVVERGHDNTIWYNRVAYNGTFAVRSGIYVDGASAYQNLISRNSIHNNSGDGIELVNGANNNLAAPSITQASCTGVSGSACAGCEVEIFSDHDGEGRIYEGGVTAHAVLPSFSWTGSVEGPNVTATVTDSQDNTSEFSLPYNDACLRLFLPLTLRNYN